ncbi:MAG TPA: aldehyde dehydrogenase family protein, partial [Spirochaetes bacterium]|nr:aldehyde dehydrogenase family protein [Spirochaetota bacterium]
EIKRIGDALFFEPTLITSVHNDMIIMREENFGPILPIMKVKDDEEGFRLVADSKYGLTSVIYTENQEKAEAFSRQMDTGTVFMNRCDYLDPALPWTGVGLSGKGSTLSDYGFHSVTRRKALHFRLLS